MVILKKGDIKPKKIRGPKKDQPVPKQKKQKGYVLSCTKENGAQDQREPQGGYVHSLDHGQSDGAGRDEGLGTCFLSPLDCRSLD